MVSSVKMEDVCAFCRSNHEKSTSQALEGVRLDMLGIVAPNFGVDVQGNNKSSESKNICFDCNENLKYLFDFKTVCLENEDHLLNFKNYETHDKINLANALQKTNFNEDVHCIDSDTDEICRLCFKRAKLEKTSALETVKNMLERCLPEIDLNLTTKTLFCDECLGMLEKHFKFLLQHDMKKELEESLIASEDVEMSTAPVDKSEISDTNTATESINDLLTNVQRQSDKLLNFCGMSTNEEPCSSSQVNELVSIPVMTTTVQKKPSSEPNSINYCGCILCQILTRGFSSFTSEEQLEIIKKGGPKPELKRLLQTYKVIGLFKIELYRFNWVTGCDSLARVFCWTCSLFPKQTDVWTKYGLADLPNFYTLADLHSKSVEHLHSTIRTRMFRISFESSSGSSDSETSRLHNLVVEQNREVLKRLVDFVCYSVLNGLNITNLSNTALSNFLSLSKRYNNTNFEKATILSSSSIYLRQNIIKDITIVVLEHIRKEVAETNFVSLILNDASVNQISVVLRYLKGNDIQERFLEFIDIYHPHQATQAVYFKIVEVASTLHCSSKLISFSYTGETIKSSELENLKQMVEKKFPSANKFPCFEHKLSSALEKSVNHIPQCKKFFFIFKGLCRFFSNSTKLSINLNRELINKHPKLNPVTWDYRTSLLDVVNSYQKVLIVFFEQIVASADQWEYEIITESKEYLQIFKDDEEFCFLLEVFAKILPQADELFSSYNNLEINKMSGSLVNFKHCLRKSSFEKTLKRFQKTAADQQRLDKDPYETLLDKILSCINKQINVRLAEFAEVKFVELCNLKKSSKINVPHGFSRLFGGFFADSNLYTELSIIAENKYITKKGNAKELLDFLTQHELTNFYSCAKKLCELVLTIPVIRCKNSALKRIEDVLESAGSEKHVSKLLFLSIEKPLLSMLYENPTFCNEVVEKIGKHQSGLNMNYKLI